MENNKEQPNDKSSSNPNQYPIPNNSNQQPTFPENRSLFFPGNSSGLYPENYSGFLPENHYGFLPGNHSGSYPVLDTSPLNPSRIQQLNPSYDRDALLADYLDSLSLSASRHHQTMGRTESFLRSRAHAAAQGQNRDLYPQQLGFAYDDLAYPNLMDSGNVFPGRPETVYNHNSWVNGSILSPNQSDVFGAANELNGLNGAMYRNNRVNGWFNGPNPNSFYGLNGPNPNRNGMLSDPMYWNNRSSSSFSRRPAQGRDRLSTSSNRLFRDTMHTSKGATRSQTGMFNKHMLSSSRPIDHEAARFGPNYIGRLNRPNGGPGVEYLNRDLKEFKGKIRLMAKNRDGSAFLKQKIEDGAQEDFEMIFEEVKDDVVELMVNYFGNTMLQNLFKLCAPKQISYVLGLLLQVKYQFVEICCDSHGGVAMVRLFQSLTTHEQRMSIISTLRGVVANLCKDQNGLKVVQHCIVHFPENVDVLLNEITDDVFGIATHKAGCVVLQDCLGRAEGETLERLVSELEPNLLLLAEHPYGNYVVQYLLEKRNPSITRIVLSWLAGNFSSLSMNKCSSNVVEKCLSTSREEEASNIIVELMNSDNFKMVIQDPYGNYVVQKAMEVSQNMRQSEIQERLQSRIMSLYGSLNSHPFGNRVICKLKHHRPNNF